MRELNNLIKSFKNKSDHAKKKKKVNKLDNRLFGISQLEEQKEKEMKKKRKFT